MAITSIVPANQSTNTASAAVKTDSNSLSMDDFFKLLSAQLQNQSMLDPVDNTEYISQMSLFSLLSEVQELKSSTQMNYALSMVGKQVQINTMTQDGTITQVTGTVQEAATQNGVNYIKVNGSYYDALAVFRVGNLSDGE